MTITGTNFGTTTALRGYTTVTVGGVAATNVSVVSDTSVTFQPPTWLALGAQAVVVTTTGGSATYNSYTVVNVLATPGAAQATVSFASQAFNTGWPITSYTVNSNNGSPAVSNSTSPITVTGLTNGQLYTFTVTANGASGNTAQSVPSNSVTPGALQTITFNNPGTKAFGTTPTLTATVAPVGLTVVFSSATVQVCTITSAGVLTFVSAADCTINADQAGDSTHLSAPRVQQTFTVSAIPPGAPTIGTATAGDTKATVAFTFPTMTGGVGLTGFTVTSDPGGLTGTGGSNPMTVIGLNNLTTPYRFKVTATNSAGTSVDSGWSNWVTPKYTQTITFGQPVTQYVGTPLTPLPATSSATLSTLTVTFTSTTTAVCTISNSNEVPPVTTVTFVRAGTCTINANQAGDSNYFAATQVSRTFSVGAVVPGAPTIGTVTAGNGQAMVAFTAPASDGGSAITSYTATCGAASASGMTGPIRVMGLTNGSSYTCTVTATNVAGIGAASAGSPVTPVVVAAKISVGFNDIVNTIVTGSDGTAYVGGNFTVAGPATGGGALLGSTLLGSASDGPDLTFPGVTGTVNSAVADGTGGWYIGGLFSQVGNVPRNNLAHILSNGDVDPNWTLGTNNTVNALAISGSTVYVGGSFSGILSLAGASTTRAKLAAIGTNGVLSTTWGPFADATVRALGISGSTLYAGGDFTTIGGLSRPYLAAITGDASTLAVVSTTWNPTANSTVNALAISGSTVYVGGAFTTIGSTRRNYLAAIGTDVNATLATTWDPSANGIVRALGISGGTLYAGGDFTTIGVLSRPYLAAITGDATTAAVVSTTWTPISNGIVKALAISGSTV